MEGMELRSVIERIRAIIRQQETLKTKSRHVHLKKASAYPDVPYPTSTYISPLPGYRQFSSFTFHLQVFISRCIVFLQGDKGNQGRDGMKGEPGTCDTKVGKRVYNSHIIAS